ncbi:polysaccharide deacetylase family protein [Actinomycetospora flava]|uniref:Polysaccharide deacetylase family protein n=1 Tax=Actinomycetospora flava TaxID=3129232 RepID=A0ABU8M6K8_9PSEU
MTTLPILMYHSVAADPDPQVLDLSVHPADFGAQLEVLREEGFTTMTFGEVRAALAGETELPARPVVLTFDDGYADFHREALPRLIAHRTSATLFVTTGWLADAGPFASGRPLDDTLTWEQVGDVDAAGVEIGAHSHSHPQLDQLPGDLLREELTTSRELLEEQLGHRVTSLAYPYGYSSRRVREAAAAAGYQHAAAVANTAAGATSSTYAVPRLTVDRSTDLARFRRIVAQQDLGALYLRQRVLTAGYAAVRRSRSAARTWCRLG